MPVAPARRSGSRRGRGGVGGDRAAARGRGLSRSTRPRPGARTSRPAGSSASTAGSSRRSSGRWPRSGRAGTRASGRPARRFAALAAANVARSGQALVVSDERTREFLAPLPLKLLPMDARRREELEELGVKRLGELAGLPGGAVAERLGPDGRRAWSLARGGSKHASPRAQAGGGARRRRSSSRRRSATS